jgi:thioredoxin-related protein
MKPTSLSELKPTPFTTLLGRLAGSAVVSCLGMLILSESARADQVEWRTDYYAARKEAKTKNRPLILDFQTVDCLWCKKLDGTTFREAAIIRLLNTRFVPLKVDAERNLSLVEALRVQSFPTLVLAGPDGKILTTLEGYVDATRLREHLERALDGPDEPKWMTRDYLEASKAIAGSDYARAIALLKSIGEDGKSRPIQAKAQQVLSDLEKQAADSLKRAEELNDQGQSTEAAASLAELVRHYAGTQSAAKASELLTTVSAQSAIKTEIQKQRAGELLAQAREEFRAEQYLRCLERCEILTTTYRDLPEASAAFQLILEIQGNPEWLQKACDSLTDRLSNFYLLMADNWIRKGQPQQAAAYLERVLKSFPGTRQAEVARSRLVSLQNRPEMQTHPKNDK